MTPLSPTALEEAAKAVSYQDGSGFDTILGRHECERNRYRDLATAAITAYLAQREKEGFVEVPANDLRAVVNLARQADDCIETECIAEYLKDRAMLTAAQNGGEDDAG